MPRIRRRRRPVREQNPPIGEQEPPKRERPKPIRRRKVSSGNNPIPVVQKNETERRQAQQSLAGFLNHNAKPETKPKRKRETLKRIDALVKDAGLRAASGEWEGVEGSVFVGLYAFCFRNAYGEIPIDLYNSEGLIGIGARNASRIVRKHFKGDTSEMVEFIKWVWEKEEGKIVWARRNGVDRKPLGLKFQFSDTLVQEYRIAGRVRRGRRR